LVENFWETGYGMPSFTLLGEKIIRFPFILHSSYPHELLHNWWGNSVYVDFETGNWCEGLTAYMADHLIKEQRDQAEEYRRSTLQKFTDFVNETNDFPLSKFLSRTDGPSEAIGYGKSLMMFHMLRLKVGDENFTRAFQSFNRTNKFKKASYKDIQTAFEEVTDKDLAWFFDQWVKRTGAPELLLKNVNVKKSAEDFNLMFEIEQVQKEDVFNIDVPIVIIDSKGSNKQILQMNERNAKFSIKLENEPLKLIIDPQFDLMRKLDPREIPPAFTKAYGAEKSLVILPIKSDLHYPEYQEFINGWIKGKEDQFEIVDKMYYRHFQELSHIPQIYSQYIRRHYQFQKTLILSLSFFLMLKSLCVSSFYLKKMQEQGSLMLLFFQRLGLDLLLLQSNFSLMVNLKLAIDPFLYWLVHLLQMLNSCIYHNEVVSSISRRQILYFQLIRKVQLLRCSGDYLLQQRTSCY